MLGSFEIPAIWLGAISTMCVLLWVSFVPQKNRINDFRSLALATCMNAIGFASVAYIPISHGLISFFLGYLLIGTADLMIRPRLMHIISESVPAHKRSLITGCVFAAIGLSVKLGSHMAGYVSTLGIPTFFSLFTLFYLAWGGVILVLERKNSDSLRALAKHSETS
jgi:dipeptide/tripeptide permease